MSYNANFTASVGSKMATIRLLAHTKRTATTVSTTTPAFRCYSFPPVSSQAAPLNFSHFCFGENDKVQCVCGSSNITRKPLVQCLQCGLWYHVQCTRLTQCTAKRSQFSCHVCRAVPSKRKKGFDPTNSMTVRIPKAHTPITTFISIRVHLNGL